MVATVQVQSAPSDNETWGDKLKKLFVRPTPTPRPSKHRKRPTTKRTPSPSPTESSPPPSQSPTTSPTETAQPSISPSPSGSGKVTPASTASVTPLPAKTPLPTQTPFSTPEAKAVESPGAQSQYFAPVRPISPGPRSRPRAIPTPRMIPTPLVLERARPTPGFPPPTPVASLPTAKSTAAPVAKKGKATTSTISIAEIAGSESYTPEVRKIIDLGLSLTTQNLGYKYNSADPARGGMDCSGFVYYVLSKSGIKNVPRDAREQYIWVRTAGKFQAVLAQRDDTFELNELKPGDLLFWAGSYGINREPDITQTMIYLGREKETNQRMMLGSSEGRTYKGQPRFGVSVLDFKVQRTKAKTNNEPGPIFVGYGSVPGLGGP